MKDTIYRQDAIDALDCINGTEEVLRSLPSAQPEKCTEERAETHAYDCISRQAAIDAIEDTDWYHVAGGELVHGANSKEDEPLYKAKDIYSVIENLPSAQPEPCEDAVSRKTIMRHYDSEEYKHVNHISRNALLDYIEQLPSAQPDVPDTNVGDMISRQAAIDAFTDVIQVTGRTNAKAYVKFVVDRIKRLPNAQLERIQNNAVHLCDSCQYTYVTCPSHGNDAVFGDGKGNDNICACNKYRPISTQHWIPCSERLPDELNVYTVTDHEGRVVRYVYNDNESSREYWKRCAKAWMPLPAPYAERREE